MKSITLILCLTLSSLANAQIGIDTQFAGGNVIIEKVSGDTVYFRPDLRDTKRNWFYWYFRVVSNEPKTWYFKATTPNALTNLGAAYSVNGENTWQWIKREYYISDSVFSFKFTEDDQVVRFAIAPPYTQANFDNFISPFQKDERVKTSILCLSNQNREVEQLLISQFDKAPKQKVLIVARAHSCEMMSSYILEGIITSLLSNTSKMKNLLASTEFMIIPFMDKDGVENGDQGKGRKPRDHNRDYSGESIYATTKKLREIVPEWTSGLPWIAIDFHNPWVKGEGHEWVYMIGSDDAKIEETQKEFAEILIQNTRSVQMEMETLFLSFGTSWNTAKNFREGWSFDKWAASEKGIKMSAIIEFPYALVYGQHVTPELARSFGQDFIYALSEFIKEE